MRDTKTSALHRRLLIADAKLFNNRKTLKVLNVLLLKENALTLAILVHKRFVEMFFYVLKISSSISWNSLKKYAVKFRHVVGDPWRG